MGLRRPPANPAPQLVQLRQAELLCVLDQHQGRVGNIHPHLDDGRRQKQLRFIGAKGRHDLVFLSVFEAAVQKADSPGRKNLLQMFKLLV